MDFIDFMFTFYGDNWADPEWNATRDNGTTGNWIENATTPDYCPLEWGNSSADRYGCIDSDAINYNPNANTDDGSCCFGEFYTVEMSDS